MTRKQRYDKKRSNVLKGNKKNRLKPRYKKLEFKFLYLKQFCVRNISNEINLYKNLWPAILYQKEDMS